jgi:hypothetical protein
MESAWDGPVTPDHVSIDDLVLCEGCVASAADILDVDPQTAERLVAERDEAVNKAERWQSYAEKLEERFGERPEPLKRTGRPPKKPVAA